MTNLASPLHRLIAFFLEILISFSIAFSAVYYLSFANTPDLVLDRLLAAITYCILLTLPYQVLYSYLISSFGGGPGKLLTGVSIIDGKNQHISFWAACFRTYVGYFVSGTLFFLGYVWIFIDKNRRAWHDLISDTYVVKTHPTGLLTGFLALVAIIVLNIWLVGQSFSNFSRHKSVYVNLYDSIKSDFPSPTPTPFLFRENSYQEPI